MPPIEVAVVASAMAILAIIAVRLTWLTVRPSAIPGEITRNRDGSFAVICAVCGESVEVSSESLSTLSPAEKALVVRERPNVIGQNLVEFACPACDASHCYSVRRNAMAYVGVNLYQGQHFQTNCKECQKRIKKPVWPDRAYDGKVNQAPGDLTDLGLQCSLCGAICCVDCCKRATRNRTSDGTLLCPRCFRGPNDHFWHHAHEAAGEPRGHSEY